MNNSERYSKYIQEKKEIWLDHSTWKGLDGESPKNRISIVNYEKETNSFKNMKLCSNAKELFSVVNNMSKSYIKWCQTKNIYTEEELEYLKKFFIGFIGEYFFTFLINTVKCMIIPNLKTGKVERFDFTDVCPRLKEEDDYGVDLTGMVSYNNKYYPCVFQVKFWNPYKDKLMTVGVAEKAFADGILNNYINRDDNKNVIVCWLGDTRNISKYLVKYEKLYKHVAFIDMKALDNSINNMMPNFWINLHNELSNISVFK